MAMAALDVARTDLGLRVPEDVSIVGFDDNELASWPKYDLTTVQQPVDRMVDATIEVLLQAIQQPQIGARGAFHGSLPRRAVLRTGRNCVEMVMIRR